MLQLKLCRLNLNISNLIDSKLIFLNKNFSSSSYLKADSNGLSKSGKKTKKTNQNQSSQNKGDESIKSSKIRSIFYLGIPVITFGLGIFQIIKYKEKLDLIENLENRIKLEPTELPVDIKDYKKFITENEYKPFKVRGYFVNPQEIILTPRYDLKLRSKLPGAYVITPFVLSNNPNMIILVNRGYVPFTHYAPTNRRKTQIDHEVELVGYLRSNEPLYKLSPLNIPPNQWHFRDVFEISKELGTSPIFLDEDESSSLQDGPQGGQTEVDLKNNHLKYIISCFSLSGLSVVIWLKNFAKTLF